METGSALKPALYLYLYGIVSKPPANLHEIDGVEGRSKLSVVEFNGLHCIVSTVPASDYSDRSHESSAQQLEWITPRALRHDEIIRYLHSATTIIPFKFGTLCATREQLQEVLERFRGSLIPLLDQFAGREEWTVKVYVDEAVISRHVEQDRQWIALAGTETSQSQGHNYFLQKKKEKLAAALADEFISSLGDDIHTRLQEFTRHIVNGSLFSTQPSNSQRLVFSAAILIDKNCSAALEELLARIESDWSECQLLTELSGPWPPYSFTAELKEFPAGMMDTKNKVFSSS